MENTNDRVIPIVFATDGKYAPFCSIAISSIIENASAEWEYHIYVFHETLTIDDIAVLKGMSTENVRVSCLNVSGHVRTELMYESDNYPRPIYYRMFIPDMLPQYNKVIYLDSDVVAVTDVAELCKIDLQGMVLGAVQDLQHKKRQKETRTQLGIDALKYFNSGVLLINCPVFREERIKEKCYDLLKNNRKFLLPDQDVLNLACLDKVYYLPLRWNLMTTFSMLPYYTKRRGPYYKTYQEAIKDPAILHYAGFYKPNNASYLGINKVFWHYAAKSPWFMDIFTGWIEHDDKMLFPQELFNMSRDIMLTGQCGWQGMFAAFSVAFRSRIAYLYRQRRKNNDRA